MKIICLVKQVPQPGAISFDEETKTLRREGVPLELNPFDRFAVQHAVTLRERVGGEVVTLTMGPPQAEEALRETLELGADRAILLSDRAFAVADTLGTSRTLALALRKEGFDVVLCGRKTVDSETWQVPPEVAAFLGVPHVTNAIALEPGLQVTRLTDEAEEVWDVPSPALVSVAAPPADISDSGAPSSEVATWSASDLVDEVFEYDKRFGQNGSPTRVLAVRDVTPERVQFRADSAVAAAAKVQELLTERPAPAASWDKPDDIAEQPGAHYDCWTLIETRNGDPTRTSLELLGRARELAGKLGGKAVALVLAEDGRGSRPSRRRTRAPRAVRGRSCRRAAHRAPPAPTARSADSGDRVGPGHRAARGGRARARHDRRLRRRRHREGGPTPAAEARVRRQHRLGDHGLDHAATRDGATADVRAARAA